MNHYEVVICMNLIYIINFYEIAVFFASFYEVKWEHLDRRIHYMVPLFWIYRFIWIELVQVTPIQIIILNISGYAMILRIIFGDKWKKNILLSVLMMAEGVCAELLTSFLLSHITGLSYMEMIGERYVVFNLIGGFLTNIMLATFLLITILLYTIYTKCPDRKRLGLIILIPIYQAALLYLLYQNSWHMGRRTIVIGLFLTVVMVVVYYLLLSYTRVTIENRLEADLLVAQYTQHKVELEHNQMIQDRKSVV